MHKLKLVLQPAGLILVLLGLIVIFSACGNHSSKHAALNTPLIEDTMVSYPGRTFSYKDKFRDTQAKQVQAAQAIGLKTPPQNRQEAAKMRSQLSLIKSNEPGLFLPAFSFSK